MRKDASFSWRYRDHFMFKDNLDFIRNLRFGLVVADYNSEITAIMRNAIYAEFEHWRIPFLNLDKKQSTKGVIPPHEKKDKKNQVFELFVPGALEIPFALKYGFRDYPCDVLIAIGCVIRGETYHFEIVSNQSIMGIMQVQLDTGVPVANGVLTCENLDQAVARALPTALDCVNVAFRMALIANGRATVI